VLSDNTPESVPPKTFDEIKARIESGDIAPAKDSPEDAAIRKASPSISAEWA
jgi:bis(5'-nucleosyl)-tetraphosphatase (symmetrical)